MANKYVKRCPVVLIREMKKTIAFQFLHYLHYYLNIVLLANI